MSLTVSEVALIAAGIGLASPLIAYWTTVRLDRERWIRAERAKVYVDMLAAYGRIARKVAHQEEEYHSLPPDEWRLLQARIEAFASRRVIMLRDPFLDAWNSFAEEETDEQARAVGNLYQKLRDTIREELRVGRVVPAG